jgi:hypothetical protein
MELSPTRMAEEAATSIAKVTTTPTNPTHKNPHLKYPKTITNKKINRSNNKILTEIKIR